MVVSCIGLWAERFTEVYIPIPALGMDGGMKWKRHPRRSVLVERVVDLSIVVINSVVVVDVEVLNVNDETTLGRDGGGG